jgi:hypothetical protein
MRLHDIFVIEKLKEENEYQLSSELYMCFRMPKAESIIYLDVIFFFYYFF